MMRVKLLDEAYPDWASESKYNGKKVNVVLKGRGGLKYLTIKNTNVRVYENDIEEILRINKGSPLLGVVDEYIITKNKKGGITAGCTAVSREQTELLFKALANHLGYEIKE